MCGIFGVVLRSDANFDRRRLPKLITKCFLLAESRGKEAAGLAVVLRDRIEIVKRPVRARSFLRDPQTQATLRSAVDVTSLADPLVVLGHTRMVTNGSPDNPDNNQPVIKGDLVCLHNGIVVNDLELWDRHPELDRDYEVDTEVLLAIVAQARRDGSTLATAVARSLMETRGANSIALLGARDEMLALATTNGSLFYVYAPDGSALMFASERYILEQICTASEVRQAFADTPPIQLIPRQGMIARFRDLRPQLFVVPPPSASADPINGAALPTDDQRQTERRIVDHRASNFAPRTPLSLIHI